MPSPFFFLLKTTSLYFLPSDQVPRCSNVILIDNRFFISWTVLDVTTFRSAQSDNHAFYCSKGKQTYDTFEQNRQFVVLDV